MADVQPYRFARYAQPSPAVVAPPYDVIGPGERDAYLARDPHNVVHLTLNTSEEDAGALFRAWLTDGTLVRDDFRKMGAQIAGLGCPTLFVMEGGYAVDDLGVNVVNVLSGFEQAG